jgi:sodium/proline symporter
VDSTTIQTIVMVLYVIFLISFGIYQGRKVKSSEDFAIAGRDLPGWVAALSERATGESSWCLLGLPGFAYAAGISSIWTAVGCVAGITTAWAVLAWRLREEAEKYDAISFMDYLAKRHGSHGRAIRSVGSLTIVFFFFFYVGAQFLGGGKTFATMYNISPVVGIFVTAAIVIPYTVYGGFQSVVYTDSVQAIIMIAALVLAPLFGMFYIAKAPGMFARSIGEALRAAGPEYTSITGGAKGFAAGLAIMGGFSWFFGYQGGTPQLSMRFMSIKDAEEGKIARNIGILWTFLGYMGALAIGWVGIAIFGPETLADPETVMPAVMMRLFHPALAALFITGAIAAMISTADSILILSATELSESIIKPFFYKDADSKTSLTLSRVITALLAVIALAITFIVPSDLIYTLVGYVWAGIGCPFSVIIILTLFWDRFSAKAVVPTIIAGLVFTIFWIATGFDETILTSRAMTFFVSLIVAVIATLATPADASQDVKA